MIPTSFDESNAVLDPPPGMSLEQCEVLSVLRCNNDNGLPVVVSCWKLTPDELAEIQRTGRVWLIVHGYSMPPVSLHGDKPIHPPESPT